MDGMNQEPAMSENALPPDLLPCPFCGHRPLSASKNADLWWISCTHCEAEISHGTREGAEAQWNRRRPLAHHDERGAFETLVRSMLDPDRADERLRRDDIDNYDDFAALLAWAAWLERARLAVQQEQALGGDAVSAVAPPGGDLFTLREFSPEQAQTVDCADAWLRVQGLPTYRDLLSKTLALRGLVAADSYAISFQTMGQYRTALLAAFDRVEAQE